jgi:hypothetical protein
MLFYLLGFYGAFILSMSDPSTSFVLLLYVSYLSCGGDISNLIISIFHGLVFVSLCQLVVSLVFLFYILFFNSFGA